MAHLMASKLIVIILGLFVIVVSMSLGIIVGYMQCPSSRCCHINNMHTDDYTHFANTLPDAGLSRREASFRLADKMPSSPWVMWLLLGDNPFMWEAGKASDPNVIEIDKSVIAALLDGVPENSHKALLLAITCHLDDPAQGRYAEKSGNYIMSSVSTNYTRPIRELARDALLRNIDKDYGYDVDLWREAIMSSHKPHINQTQIPME